MNKNEGGNKLIKMMVFIKKIGFFIVFCIFLSFFESKSSVFNDFLQVYKKFGNPSLKNQSFKSGEILKYRISYGRKGKKGGVLLAGHAQLKVDDTIMHDQDTVQKLVASGRTTNFFSLFLKVKHSYTSFINRKSLKSIKCLMKIKEGKYYIEDEFIFPEEIQTNDMLGTFYKLRTIPQKNVIGQDTVFFSYYYNRETYKSYFINHGEEMISTKFGEIKTIKCEPLLEKGRIFNSQKGAFVWITSNKLHIPVKLEIPILVGSIYVNLVSYENTIFDLNE